MSEPDTVALARAMYAAYEQGDRAAAERILADDFRFDSPVDTGLDRAGYFERCWPNEHLESIAFVRLIPHGDEVVVTYEQRKRDGSRGRNTEVLTFAGDRLTRVEVYFGWNL